VSGVVAGINHDFNDVKTLEDEVEPSYPMIEEEEVKLADVNCKCPSDSEIKLWNSIQFEIQELSEDII